LSLAQKAGKAGALMLFRKGWGALVSIGVMAYLARTLDKEDFGLVAISGSLISFIQVLGLSGISEYVVFYNGEDRKSILNSAFWLNFWVSVAIVAITLLALPFWSKLYNDTRIVHLVILLLVGFFFTTLSSTPISIFRKELNYGPMIAIQTVFGTISQLLTILFALLGFGVFSLALPSAIIPPLLCVTYFWKTGFRPNFLAHGQEYWGKIFSYTKHVIGSRVLSKFVNEGDTLIVGKLLGIEALGIYDLAFKLANMLNTQFLPIVTNIALPVFAHNGSDKKTIGTHYLKMVGMIAVILFPLYSVAIVFAEPIITFLYGAKWITAIIPFQILSFFSILRSLSSPSSGLYNALDKPEIGFYFTLVFAPIFLFTLVISAQWGLIAMCAVVTLLRIAGSFYHLSMACTLSQLKGIDTWNAIRWPFVVSFVTAIFVYLLETDVIIKVLIFIGLFFALSFVFFRKELLKYQDLFLNLFKNNR
jgi:O-antigen/teichoic acid export membrane protein